MTSPNLASKKTDTTWIDFARIAAAFAVVMVHCSGSRIITQEYPGVSNVIGDFFYNSISQWCVPIFVMISGALLLNPNKTVDMFDFYKKRLSKLIIPCTFWIIIYLVLRFLADYSANRPHDLMMYVQAVCNGSVFYHTWYIFMLLGLYLFTPVLQKALCSMNKKETLWFLIIVWFITFTDNLGYGSPRSKLFLLWFLQYVGYYLLGYYLRFFVTNTGRFYVWIPVFVLSSAAIGYLRYRQFHLNDTNHLSCITYCSPYIMVQSLAVICMIMPINYKSEKFNKVCKYLAPYTLGIYLAHPLIRIIMEKAGFRLPFTSWLAVPIDSIIVFLCTLLLVLIMRKLPISKHLV